MPNTDVTSDWTAAFIVGAPRSGTTLLASILARHSRIAVPPETHFLRTYARRLWNLYSLLKSKNRHETLTDFLLTNVRILDLALTKEDILREFSQYPANYSFLFRAILQAFGLKNGKTIVIEKTPHHLEYVDTLVKWYPQVRIIHLVRDGRDVSMSLMQVPWTHNNIERHAAYWAWCMRVAKRYEQQYPNNFLSIHFEALISEPENTVRRICDFIGVAYEEIMLDASVQVDTMPEWEKQWKQNSLLNPISGKLAQWKLQDKSLVAHIQTLMANELVSYGYPLAEEIPQNAITMQQMRKRLLWHSSFFSIWYALVKVRRLFAKNYLGYRKQQLKNAGN